MSAPPYVLVVDDHPMNVRLLECTLEIRGIATRVARNAEETIRALEEELPGVVLMDVQLPGMDGLTLTRKLRADPRYATLPIVAVTAYAMPSDERAARDAGCTAFVPKPIDTTALGDLVLALLGAPSSP
jgi:CheY-like chemotaxis protein